MNHTKKLTLGALIAAVFAVTAFLFKGFVIIPGLTEIRPVNAYPIVFGLLFGSLGAWSIAIGNLLGDILGGTLTLASIGGFIGNYAMTYIPYAVWQSMKKREGELFFQLKTKGDYAFLGFLCFLSATSSAIIIPVFADIVGIMAFNVVFAIIFINNIIAELSLGVLLYLALTTTKTTSTIVEYVKLSQEKMVRFSRGKALCLIGVLACSFALGVFFFVAYPKTLGQLDMLIPMAFFSAIITALISF